MSLRACCGTTRGAAIRHLPDCPHAAQHPAGKPPAHREMWRATHPKQPNLTMTARGRTYHWRKGRAPLTLCGMLPVGRPMVGAYPEAIVCVNCRSIDARDDDSVTAVAIAIAAKASPQAQPSAADLLPPGLSFEEAVALQVKRDRGRS